MEIIDILLIILFLLVFIQTVNLFRKSSYLKYKQRTTDEIEALIKEGCFEKAEELVNSLLKKNKRDADAYYTLGFINSTRGKPEEALKAYTTAVKIKNNFPEAHYALGHIYYYNIKDKRSAVIHLEKAVRFDRKLLRAYNTLCLIYYAEGKYDKVIKILDIVIRKYGADSNIYNTLGLAKYKKTDVTGAIDAFKKAVELSDMNIEALLNLGNIYSLNMEYDEALKVFHKAEYIEIKNKFIKYWLGSTYYLKKDLKTALAKLNDAISIDKNFALAYLQRSQVNKKLNNRAGYREDYNKAISLNPELKLKGDTNE